LDQVEVGHDRVEYGQLTLVDERHVHVEHPRLERLQASAFSGLALEAHAGIDALYGQAARQRAVGRGRERALVEPVVLLAPRDGRPEIHARAREAHAELFRRVEPPARHAYVAIEAHELGHGIEADPRAEPAP